MLPMVQQTLGHVHIMQCPHEGPLQVPEQTAPFMQHVYAPVGGPASPLQ